MAIARPCYCNRDDVMRAQDIKSSVLANAAVDRAIASAADDIEGAMKRRFYPIDTIRFFDWPNYQYAYPWRFWFGKEDCCALTLLQSPGAIGGVGGVSIPLWQVLLRNKNADPGFPFTYMELDRSTVAAWGIGPTPQHSIWATGTWGFTADADNIGALAAGILAGDGTITLNNGALCGAGDLLIIGYGRGTAPFPAYAGTAGAVQPYLGERVLVTDKSAVTTGLTVFGTGCTSESSADDQLATTGTGSLNVGEVLQIDGERMLIESITGGVATVHRAWDGTALNTHSTGATVNAYRQLSVLRGQCGTTAAAANSATAVYRHRPPQLIRDLAIAIAEDQALQELSGYSRTVGSDQAVMRASGFALADKWQRAKRRFGRQQRMGTI
jgi:hypothetical protein